MQLTARQRYFVRVVAWALPVSVVLGTIFGHFHSLNDSARGYIHGAVAGILISTAILLIEFVVDSRTVSGLIRRVPFLLYLALRSLAYLVAILFGLTVSAWLTRGSAGSEPLIERGGVLPDFDFHAPLLSLPLAFNTTLSTIPARKSTLGWNAQPIRRSRIAARRPISIRARPSSARSRSG